jgi:FkbM family methyltransferase
MDLEKIYDRQTTEIMSRTLRQRGTFIDVGCHLGKFMDEALRIAPAGHHYGFEPLPDYAAKLKDRYASHPNVTILDAALSDTDGETSFVYNIDVPSHSGLRERDYPFPDTRRETIRVRTRRLDDVLPSQPVAMIKIDVEGAELLVLRGAARILAEQKPTIVFEFGLGASNHYATHPRDVFQLLSENGMGVFTLDGMLRGRAPLRLAEFEEEYFTPRNYYFGAQALRAQRPAFMERVRRRLLGVY